MVHFGAFVRALMAFLGITALEMAFMKTLQGCLQSLSIQYGLLTLPEGRAKECSFVPRDWALFLRFLAWFMGILWLFEGLF